MNKELDLSTFGGNSYLLEEFHRQGVRFLVIGGLAVQFYAPEREADDLDLMLDPAPDNAVRVLASFVALRLNSSFDASALQRPKAQIQLKQHHYADLLTPDSDINFAQEWENASACRVNGVPVRVASRELLIRMQSRRKDRKHEGDLKLLEPK